MSSCCLFVVLKHSQWQQIIYHDKDSGKTENLDNQAFLRTTTKTAEEGEEEWGGEEEEKDEGEEREGEEEE